MCLKKYVAEAYKRQDADRILSFKCSKFVEEKIWTTITFERDDFNEYEQLCQQRTCGVQTSYHQLKCNSILQHFLVSQTAPGGDAPADYWMQFVCKKIHKQHVPVILTK